MKKYIFYLVLIVMLSVCGNFRQAEAYSVTVQKDGIYAEAIPDSFVNNTAVIFKKYVKKAMKYYHKYKDADTYTYMSKIPDEYRDFIPVARQIQDSDEIIIRNPFYIYQVSDAAEPEIQPSSYCFYAEKNGKKLCMFCIDINVETGKLSLRYDKMENSHFTYDEETMENNHFVYDKKTLGETLFYEIDEAIYAETPDKTSVVWNRKLPEGATHEMILVDGVYDPIDWKAMEREFNGKAYDEKKDEILGYLTKTKKSRLIKKVEKNLKQQLKDEYVESEEESSEAGNFTMVGVYILLGIGIMVIGVIVGECILKQRSAG
ncbi:MAG: hypothetical protein J1E62_10705 [Lachnospiraceae bacterium]|nr:hypothetical protein [Lachnospiraceae bacterium]